MFTGIIEEIGKISSIKRGAGESRLVDVYKRQPQCYRKTDLFLTPNLTNENSNRIQLKRRFAFPLGFYTCCDGFFTKLCSNYAGTKLGKLKT